MAFATGTSASSGAYQDLMTKLIAFATSKHISAVTINNAGTGYTVGDLLTISHAGGYLPATLQVTAISGGGGTGPISAVAIRSAGAFSNRVASATVVAGGTGYTTGNIVRLTTGTYTQYAKFTVTASSGIVSTLTPIETGGAYSVAPSTGGATSTDVGVAGGTGLTATATMTGLIGTSGIAATAGTGASATFNLTLTDTGWTALWDRNNFTTNSITTEKEVILMGTVTGGDEPYIGLRSFTATSGDTRYGWVLVGMDSFNNSLTFANQANCEPEPSPTDGSGMVNAPWPICFKMFDNAQSYWFSVKGRRIIAVVKAVGVSTTTYQSMYAGLLNPFGTQAESPYPMYLSASTRVYTKKPDDAGVTGLTELIVVNEGVGASPAAYRRKSDGTYMLVCNAYSTGASYGTDVVYPIGAVTFPIQGPQEDNLASFGQCSIEIGGAGFTSASGGSASEVLMPTLGSNELILFPATVLASGGGGTAVDNGPETLIRGELDDVYWIPGTKSDGNAVVSEDTITIGSDRYRIFANAARSERYSYFALKEN